jgi:hypothetical protein
MAENEVDPKLAQALKTLESTPIHTQEKVVAAKSTGHTFSEPFYKKHKNILFVIAGLVVVLVASLIIIKPSTYTTVYLKNSDVKFSFSFSKSNQAVKVVDQNGLEGWNLSKTNKLTVVTDISPFHLDCGSKSSGLTSVFTTKLYGKTVSTCVAVKNIEYVTTFEKSNKWYIIDIISSNQKTPIDNKTAKTVVSSVKVL